MDTLSTIATLFASYFFFAFANLNIIFAFHGFDNSIVRQMFMQQLWLSDKIFNTYDSVCEYRYANTVNWWWTLFVILCPVFNIIWLAMTTYRLYKFYIRNF